VNVADVALGQGFDFEAAGVLPLAVAEVFVLSCGNGFHEHVAQVALADLTRSIAWTPALPRSSSRSSRTLRAVDAVDADDGLAFGDQESGRASGGAVLGRSGS